MNKIIINLASGNYPESRLPFTVASVLLIFALLFTVVNTVSYTLNLKKISSLEVEFESLDTMASEERLKLMANAPEVTDELIRALKNEVEFINGIIYEETFSWTELLSNIESSLPKRVFIVQISPTFRDSKVRISGMAKTKQNVLDFVEALSNSSRFKNVFLLKHSENKRGRTSGRSASSERIIFSVSATYVREVL
ncbi:MAG: PilN domain-containing protein [Deltaproteobacteria bacterium]|nr:PilN domain-containing protein [Deltaproteobacteria bacterium]